MMNCWNSFGSQLRQIIYLVIPLGLTIVCLSTLSSCGELGSFLAFWSCPSSSEHFIVEDYSLWKYIDSDRLDPGFKNVEISFSINSNFMKSDSQIY